MSHPQHTYPHWTSLEADRAFTAAARAGRHAALVGRLRRFRRAVCGLPAYDEALARRSGPRGIREIPLDTIAGTTEPNRAAQFEQQFRPTPRTRCRWQRIWMAMHQGITLPPISVVHVGDGYAIRDGHHRVSVAKARGGLSITAVVAG
jgi:hypothetical protein